MQFNHSYKIPLSECELDFLENPEENKSRALQFILHRQGQARISPENLQGCQIKGRFCLFAFAGYTVLLSAPSRRWKGVEV